MVNIVDISGIVVIMLVCMFVIFIVGFKLRKTPILKMFGSQYFTFEIINEAGMSTFVNRVVSDFKVHGQVILFSYKRGWYRVMETQLFFRNRVPCSMYRFANPMPINVMAQPDNEIAVYDEDSKTMVKVKMAAQELRDAIEAKVVHDLNKFTFSRMEMISIIISVVSIIVGIIVLYEIVQVSGNISNLIGQLNQILAHLPAIPTTPTTGG